MSGHYSTIEMMITTHFYTNVLHCVGLGTELRTFKGTEQILQYYRGAIYNKLTGAIAWCLSACLQWCYREWERNSSPTCCFV